MGFKRNDLPCDHKDSFQLTSQHTRQLHCGSQFGFSGHMHIPGKQYFAAGPRGNSECEKIDSVTSNHNSWSALGDTSGLSLGMGNNGDTIKLETSGLSLGMGNNGDTIKLENNIKRPFGGSENLQAAAKRTKQMGGDIPAVSSTCEGSFTPFTAYDNSSIRKDDGIPDGANDSWGSSFSFPWFSRSTSVREARIESPVKVLFYPGYYEDHWRPAGHNRREEYRSPVFDYLPQKHVAIGPDHQVDIPILRSRSPSSNGQGDGPGASASAGKILTDEDNCKKWTGHCVMPMPDSISVEEPLRRFKTDFPCIDEGSIRCVRQHVREARYELRSSLGQERFVELGFHNMGEDVALGWTKEEELLFNEVVASNPASSGKNFWNDLPLAFPMRSSKELVSYYFNVFMLRKRAEQNRCDSLNVDSDDDECQYSDDDEFEATEEDEEDDSGVESPADAAAEGNRVRTSREVDIHEEAVGDYSKGEEYSIGDGKSKFGPHVQHVRIHSNEFTREDRDAHDEDVHDDSCTSYEGQHNGVEAAGGGVDALDRMRHSRVVEADHRDIDTDYGYGGMGGMIDDDFISSHCDPRPWEVGFFCGLGKDVEFLPTCNVIEEVFGNESWEKNRGGHGVS